MNKLQKTVLDICKCVVIILFSALAIYFFLIGLFSSCVMVYTDQHVYFLKDYAFLLLSGLVTLVLLLAFLWKKIKLQIWDKLLSNKVLGIITCFWFIWLIVWIFVTIAEPSYDQMEVLKAAYGLAHGDYSQWNYGVYMYLNVHQNGIALWYALFYLLFPSHTVLAIEIFNLTCWFGTICGISKLAFRYFESARISRVVYLGMLFFFPAWGYVTYVYGTVPSLFLCVWAMNMEKEYEESGNLKYGFYTAILLFLAVMWKQNSLVFVIGIGILFILDAIRTKHMKSVVALLFVIAFVYLECVSIPFVIRQITGTETNHSIPALGFVAMGLNESSMAPGWFNEFTTKVGRANCYIKENMNQASLLEIKNRMQVFRDNPEYGVRFFARKLCAMWNSPDFQAPSIVSLRNYHATFDYWVKDILYNGGIMNTILFLIADVFQSIYTCGIVLYLIFERKKLDLEKMAPMIILIGGFAFHIFWEAKTEYAFPYYILLFPYAVKGYQSITLYLKNKWEHHERNYWKDAEMYIIGALLCIAIAIGISNSTLVTSTIKLGTDTSEYIYYCQNETQWKHPEYHRSDDLEVITQMNNLKYE